MPEFAEFSTPSERLTPLASLGLVVRDATSGDLPAMAEITARREGGEAATYLDRLRRSLGRPECTLCVAVFESRVIGLGRSSLIERPKDAPPNAIPTGWYLGGLVVTPGFRRRGVGLELTRGRLHRLWERVPRVYYFATAINTPTIALHARLGFREIARDIWAEGVTFTGGVGVLFEATREDHAAATRSHRDPM